LYPKISISSRRGRRAGPSFHPILRTVAVLAKSAAVRAAALDGASRLILLHRSNGFYTSLTA
jgi:hypothetical protein